MTISSTAVGNGGATNGKAITVSFVASESTIDLVSPLSVSGGELSNFQEAVQAIQQHLPNGDGVKTIDVAAGSASEAALEQLGMISIILLLTRSKVGERRSMVMELLLRWVSLERRIFRAGEWQVC